MRIAVLITIFVFAVTSSYSGQALNDYLKQAAENNPALKAKFNEYMAALQKVPQVSSLPDPKLAFRYFVSPVETRVGPQSFNLSLSQMFPWFGKLEYQGKAAIEQAKAKYEAFESLKDQIYFDVKKTWYQIFNLDQRIKIISETIKLIESFKSVAQVKSEVGEATLVDAIRADLELGELKNKLKLYEDSRIPLVSELRRLIDDAKMEIEPVNELDVNSLDQTKQDLLDSVMTNNPVLKQLLHTNKSYENKSIAAERAGYPNITFGLNYISVNKRTDSSVPDNGKDVFAPMIGISLPIYRSKYSSMAEEARLLQTVIDDRIRDYKNQLTAEFEKLYRDYSDAYRRITLYENQIVLAKQALDILLIAYSTASKDFEEVLRMESKVLRYELELIKAKKDQNIAVAGIMRLTGNN